VFDLGESASSAANDLDIPVRNAQRKCAQEMERREMERRRRE
jgi:hypothetical protein